MGCFALSMSATTTPLEEWGDGERPDWTKSPQKDDSQLANADESMEGRKNEGPATLMSGLDCYEAELAKKKMPDGGSKEFFDSLSARALLVVAAVIFMFGVSVSRFLPFEMAADEAKDIAALRQERDNDKRELNEHLERVEMSLNKTADAEAQTTKAVDALADQLKYTLPLSSNQTTNPKR